MVPNDVLEGLMRKASKSNPNQSNVSKATSLTSHTPNYSQHVALQLKEARSREGVAGDIGPGATLDTACTVPVIAEKDRDKRERIILYTLPAPVELEGVHGTKILTEGGVMKAGSVTMEGVISDTSPISLIPASYLLADGSTLVMKLDACVLCKLEPDVKTIRMVRNKQGMFTLPWLETEQGQDLEVHKARIACAKEINEHVRRMHVAHVKRCLIPKCNTCESCLMGKMNKGDGWKGPLAPTLHLPRNLK